MSNPQAISSADLSTINRALRELTSDMSAVARNMSDVRSDITGVQQDVLGLHGKQDRLEAELTKFSDAFTSFVQADTKHKALQLAETRVGNLQNELQIKFGYYAEVRRMATGILQGVDTGIVSDDTLRHATEEVMIKAPGYWLAPILVVMASWIRNDKGTAEKALQESLKRDDYKTTLLFTLVMRRLSRNDASLKWLERYFDHQNPYNLNREFVVMLEAATTGVFPPAARLLMMGRVKTWLHQLTQSDNFVNDQKAQWVNFFKVSAPPSDGEYPLLQKYSTNWPALADSIAEARTHAVLITYFKGVLSPSIDFSKGIKVQLDEILSMLVTNFDDEELPLQEQVRLNQLIVQLDGDKAAAQAKINAEKYIFDEKVDFLQLLTNASFNPELSGVTKATQTLAVSISQPWIVEAHDTFTAQSRQNVPQTAQLSIDDFKTTTKDGKDETELLKRQDAYYADILKRELAGVPFPFILVGIGGLLPLVGLTSMIKYNNYAFFVLTLAIGGLLIWQGLSKYQRAKKALIARMDARKTKAREVLRGCVAELVDYRKIHAQEDAKAESLRQLLNSITAEDFSSLSKETARNII